jgi:uncharacterized protein (TIGR02646 family)
MRKIVKGNEPPVLSDWKRRNPNGQYQDLSHVERQTIRDSCLKEQYYLCAYCCQRIDGKNSHNEHIQTQQVAPNQMLNFHNIVASCNKPKQCGKAHRTEMIPLTPLMAECETELEFNLSGRVKGLTQRANESINLLNLGDDNKALVQTRKQLVKTLIFMHRESPEKLQLLDDDLLQILMEEISQSQDGQLSDFAPILQNILRQFLKQV